MSHGRMTTVLRSDCIRVSPLPLTHCITLDKLMNLSELVSFSAI